MSSPFIQLFVFELRHYDMKTRRLEHETRICYGWKATLFMNDEDNAFVDACIDSDLGEPRSWTPDTFLEDVTLPFWNAIPEHVFIDVRDSDDHVWFRFRRIGDTYVVGKVSNDE